MRITKEQNSKHKIQKGITLIALVITIVLMLILATITVNVVIDGGLFGYAKKAKDNTEIASEKSAITQAAIIAKEKNKQGKIVKEEIEKELNRNSENTKVEENEKNFIVTMEDSGRKYFLDNKGKVREVTWSKTTDEEGNNYVTKGKVTLQIGDYITYDANDNGEYTYTAEDEKTGATTEGGQIFSSNFETKWRLLGVEHASDGDYLMIVPETPIQSTTATGLYLRSGMGYQHGIAEMENISKIYGHGTGASSARAMTVEDVNKITGYDPLNTGDGTIFREGELGEYQNVVTCTKAYNSEGGTLLNGENGATNIYSYYWFNYYDENSEQILNVEEGKSIKLTNTYYSYYPTTLTENSTGEIKGIKETDREYSVLFKTQENKYWLASPFVCVWIPFQHGKAGCTGFFMIDGTIIKGKELFTVGNSNISQTQDVMPIVYLKADVNLRTTGNTVNECTEWEIY